MQAVMNQPTTGTTARRGIIGAASMVRAENSPVQKIKYEYGTKTGFVQMNIGDKVMPYIDTRHFIVSIYPGWLKYQQRQGDVRQGGRGVTMFSLPPAKRGEYQILEVAPCVAYRQKMDALDLEPAFGDLQVEFTPSKIIAEGLISIWARGVQHENGRPGVGLLPDNVEEGSPEFLEFLGNLTEQQSMNFNSIVDEAQAAFTRGERIGSIDRAIIAAEWLYGPSARDQFKWFGRQQFVVTKECMVCGTHIPKMALRCTGCNADLIKTYADWGITAEGTDDIVFLYQRMISEFKRAPTPKMVNRVMSGEAVSDVIESEDNPALMSGGSTASNTPQSGNAAATGSNSGNAGNAGNSLAAAALAKARANAKNQG